MFPTEKSPKISFKFVCETCNYKCSKPSEYNKHILTNKHKILQNPTCIEKSSKTYECDCGKIYKHSSTLYSHKKTCDYIKTNPDSSKKEEPEYCDKELIMMLIKENSELKTMMIESQTSTQNMMIEVMKTGINSNSNNNNTITKTNSHNKTFNLQFFLNETCKDAMNITEFVNSIQLQLSDLERVGELGYVEGISNIITSNLNALDVTQRPIHCTDKKRETMYVKDEDKWEKEAEEKKKLRKVIKTVSSKNIQMLPNFVKAHPDCKHSDSKYSDQYGQIIIESMSNDKENEEKIIKKISEKVTVDKEGDQ